MSVKHSHYCSPAVRDVCHSLNDQTLTIDLNLWIVGTDFRQFWFTADSSSESHTRLSFSLSFKHGAKAESLLCFSYLAVLMRTALALINLTQWWWAEPRTVIDKSRIFQWGRKSRCAFGHFSELLFRTAVIKIYSIDHIRVFLHKLL